jgi:regulation of enolase protein 1 (concanavalin A-like superfamily)
MFNLVYAANPRYGGWVTFTAHLYHVLKKFGDVRLFRISKRLETRTRNYGYGIRYQNIPPETLDTLKDFFVTAIDKSHYRLMPRFAGKRIVIHDPTEFKAGIEFMKGCKVVTIRERVKQLLSSAGVKSTMIPHPFFKYKIANGNRNGAVSISRVDFDKHTDMICKANRLMNNGFVKIYGAENRIYVHHKLKGLGFENYYMGKFAHSFLAVSEILASANFVVDMSSIKGDGDGSQYTFLEAIHNGCALVLNKEWTDCGGYFKPGVDCISVASAEELAVALDSADHKEISGNAMHLLRAHASDGNHKLWKECLSS